MEELMNQGWRFELFMNKLGTYTAIATKGEKEIVVDAFHWWPLITAIVEKVNNESLPRIAK